MHLRELRFDDAPLMLEWIHDPSVVANLKARFADKTLEDCHRFILSSREGESDVHFAIADETDDTYLGTVSLKHVTEKTAEFAITIRKSAMGTGVSRDAMRAILDYGFERLGLERIFWCVSPENVRAVRFYDKQGYPRSELPEEAEGYSEEEARSYIWYTVPNPHGAQG